jgi:hypothetical protein
VIIVLNHVIDQEVVIVKILGAHAFYHFLGQEVWQLIMIFNVVSLYKHQEVFAFYHAFDIQVFLAKIIILLTKPLSDILLLSLL